MDEGKSPTLEQESKRQRISSSRRVDVSHDSSSSSQKNAFNNNSSSGESSIAKAIETQLTLEERVISSPSAMIQSYSSRRRRGQQQELLRPAKTSNDLNISADSMDGMAALATAAFLRLDETDD